jgi:hypothetical protein
MIKNFKFIASHILTACLAFSLGMSIAYAADVAISGLTALTGAGTADDDELVIVDTSATETKKIDVSELGTKILADIESLPATIDLSALGVYSLLDDVNGATCDGSTDDTVAIQAWLDAAINGGTLVGAPGKDCVIGTASGVDLSNHTNITLDLRGTTFSSANVAYTGDSHSNPLLFIDNCDQCKVIGGIFDGSGTTTVSNDADAIMLDNSEYTVIQGVTAHSMTGNKSLAESDGDGNLWLDNVVRDSQVGGSSRGIWLGNSNIAEYTSNVSVIGNRVYNMDGTGIVIQANGATVTGNISEGNNGSGIISSGHRTEGTTTGVKNHTITGNVMKDNEFYCYQSDITATHECNTLTVANNVCRAEGATAGGILMNSCKNWSITNNVITNPTDADGIIVEATEGPTINGIISNNTIVDDRGYSFTYDAEAPSGDYVALWYEDEGSDPVAYEKYLSWDAGASEGYISDITDDGTSGSLTLIVVKGQVPGDNDVVSDGTNAVTLSSVATDNRSMDSGIHLTQGTIHLIDNILVKDNTIHSSTEDSIIFNASTSTSEIRNLRVEGNTLIDSGEYCIFAAMNGGVENIRVEDNRMESCHGTRDVRMTGFSSCTDCLFSNNQWDGDYTQIDAALLLGAGIIESGQETLSSGTASVTFGNAEKNTTYSINLGCAANETFYFSSKATSGFTINSSNASSTAACDWSISR